MSRPPSLRDALRFPGQAQGSISPPGAGSRRARSSPRIVARRDPAGADDRGRRRNTNGQSRAGDPVAANRRP